MNFNLQETATVLAALRVFQETEDNRRDTAYLDGEVTAFLTDEQIDALCERINCNPEATEPTAPATTPLAALLTAEEFVEDELENRDAGDFKANDPYIMEPNRVLSLIRIAIDSLPRPASVVPGKAEEVSK